MVRTSTAKGWGLWVWILGFLVLAPTASAAELYTVSLGASPSPPPNVILKGEKICSGAMWVLRQKGKSVYCCGTFMHRAEAEQLRKKLQKTVAHAEILHLSNTTAIEWIPNTFRIFLADLGFTRPILARGFSSYAAFRFPWESGMDPRGSTLHLKLRASPFLNERSTLTVMVEGIPMGHARLGGRRNEIHLPIPLDRLSEIRIGPFLDVQVLGHLSITDDRCADEPTGNLWMLIDNKSFLDIRLSTPPNSIKAFLTAPARRFRIVAERIDHDTAEAVLKLAALIGALSPAYPSIDIGPSVSGSSNIFVGPFPRDIQLFGGNLYLTPRGVDLLISRWLPTSIFSEILKGGTSHEERTPYAEITFEDLGLETHVMRGIGDLSFSVPFNTLQMGGWPTDLSCTLVFCTTPVHPRERAFLKVKLNGALVASVEVKGEGTIRTRTFRLPARYIRFSNHLEITVSYVLNRGDCHGSLPEMEVTVFKDSFFSVHQTRRTPPLSLATYPAVLSGKGTLILDALTWDDLETAGLFLASLAHQVRDPLDFQLKSLENGIDSLKTSPYALLFLRPENLARFDPLVDLSSEFRIVHPLTRKVLFRCETTDPLYVVQTFSGPSGVPLWIGSGKNGLVPSRSMVSRIFTSSDKANVMIFRPKTSTVYEVGEKLRVVYPSRKDLGYYWNRYRLAVFIVLACGALVFLFYIYSRLAKR